MVTRKAGRNGRKAGLAPAGVKKGVTKKGSGSFPHRKKGSGSFPCIGSRPAAWPDLHGALSQRFDLPTESLAAPRFLLLRMQAQRIDAVCVHTGKRSTICVKPRDAIRSQREVKKGARFISPRDSVR